MIIRKVKVDDDKEMLKMLKALDNETKFMMFEPGERPDNTAGIHGMIKQAVSGKNLLLIAEDNDSIVGFLSADRGGPKKIRHTAYIVVGIRSGYRNQGIGSKFFSELDTWAVKEGITRLELTVMCPNEAAKHLYGKNGFEVEGIKKNSIFMDGRYIDEYYMAKLLKVQ